jgi:SWI/SNF-related matrix-associated actin-dependent regulator of chromatin subfamily A-like protein 1
MTQPQPQPKTYQNIGIDFLAQNRRAFLLDDAGLGKSLQLIRAANKVHADRILIIAPATAKGSWRLQLAEWDQNPRPVLFYPGHKGQPQELPKGPLAVVVSMEWLSRPQAYKKLIGLLAGTDPFDVAFIDEGQGLKTDTAERTRSVYGPRLDLAGAILERVKYRWIATATPTPLGHVGELYTHLRALFPDVLRRLFNGATPGKWAFVNRYCSVYETRFGREIVGNREDTIGELRAALKPFMLMRRKADVLHELPPIQAVPLPVTTNFKASVSEVSDAEIEAMSEAEFQVLLNREQTHNAALRNEFGAAKAKAALPWLREYLEDDPKRKVLVYGHHREVLAILQDGLRTFSPVIVHGAVSPDEKEQAVADFQTKPGVRVFIGQNIAAGTAITLTAADAVVLVEPHPSPDQNYQIISRAHRLGQKNSVTAYIVYDEKVAMDRRQAQVLRRRANDNREMFGVETPGVI